MTRARHDPLILIPIYGDHGDWDALGLLLPDLAARLAEDGREAEVVIVDDGSALRAPSALGAFRAAGIARVEILRLRRNLGHQRALAIGLAWVAEERRDRVGVVMDGDGEDSPRDVPRLLRALEADAGEPIVFAARARRAEGAVYWLGYRLYKIAHRVLTGIPVRVGNFSAIPPARLAQLVVTPELWNHYAAAVFHARLPVRTVAADRAPRLAGRSSMNFVALVTHGMSAISVFGDTVGVRLLAASTVLVSLLLLSMLAALGSGAVVQGWLLPLGLALMLLLQLGTLSALFVFGTLQARSGVAFLPARDYRWFVERAPAAAP